MIWNIPNILTTFRIILIPIFVIISYLSIIWEWANLVAAIVFAIAAITDWFDGFLARRYQQITKFGAFLDPVADKLIIVIALLVVVTKHPTIYYTLPAMIIISREVVISALREWMAQLGKQSKVAVSWLGKIKTTAQLVSLTLLIWDKSGIISYLALILLYIAVIMTIWSMTEYLLIAKEDMKENN